MAKAWSETQPCYSEDNLEDDEEYSVTATGPIERRMKKKKRSESISRVFSATVKGVKKAISRSATPVAPGRNRQEDAAGVATPLPLSMAAARFTSPRRLPAKRKAKEESELSPRSKQQRRRMEEAMEMTPKVRGRSLSVKHFKQNSSKTFKLPPGAEIQPPPKPLLRKFSPLPSRSSFRISTPPTPALLGIPRQGSDIVTPPSDSSSCVADANISEDVNSSMASLMNVKSADSSSNSATSSSRASARQTSLSPKEKKIGAMRGRRRATSKPTLLQNISGPGDLKAQLRRGGGSGQKASRSTPLRVPPPTSSACSSVSSSAKKSSVSIRSSSSSAKKSHQESLLNLRQDISSVIEQSFGPSDISGVQAFDAADASAMFAAPAAPAHAESEFKQVCKFSKKNQRGKQPKKRSYHNAKNSTYVVSCISIQYILLGNPTDFE